MKFSAIIAMATLFLGVSLALPSGGKRTNVFESRGDCVGVIFGLTLWRFLTKVTVVV